MNKSSLRILKTSMEKYPESKFQRINLQDKFNDQILVKNFKYSKEKSIKHSFK